jgi:hypothetical protein
MKKLNPNFQDDVLIKLNDFTKEQVILRIALYAKDCYDLKNIEHFFNFVILDKRTFSEDENAFELYFKYREINELRKDVLRMYYYMKAKTGEENANLEDQLLNHSNDMNRLDLAGLAELFIMVDEDLAKFENYERLIVFPEGKEKTLLEIFLS